MLWHQVQQGATFYREAGNPALQSVHLAASDVLGLQVKNIAIPRRFSNVAREIWTMQGRFQFKACRRSVNFLDNKRFRAAYDFMCLRASSGEPLQDDCEWWTLFQKVDADEQLEMCNKSNGAPRRNRSGRRRRQK